MSLKTATAQASTLGEPIKKEKLQVRANLALTEHNLPFLPTEHWMVV